MNKLVILGNLTRDPELKKTNDGISVCNFTVAVNRHVGKKQVTDFVRVTAWRERGEVCYKYLKKGSKVLVMGPVAPNAWIGTDGAARGSLEITADEVEFCGSSRKDDAQAEEPAAAAPAEPVAVDVDDELPF